MVKSNRNNRRQEEVKILLRVHLFRFTYIQSSLQILSGQLSEFVRMYTPVTSMWIKNRVFIAPHPPPPSMSP